MVLQIAKAIIVQNDRFLLQLRDDSVDILYPNQWSFFGGEVELDETPWQALQRELEEELEWRPKQGYFLYPWINPEYLCRIHFFTVLFEGKASQLILHEGQEMGWFNLNELVEVKSMAFHVKQHTINAINFLNNNLH